MRFSPNEIMKMTKPGELFSDDIKIIKNEYLKLAKVWHPDYHDNSKEHNEIMTKINFLYMQCINSLSSGIWERPGLIRLFGKDGRTYEVKYQVAYSFELGTMYISRTVILYLINNEYMELIQNAEEVIGNFTFANDEMRLEVSKYLPKIICKFETIGNQFGVVIEKSPELFLLRDVLNFYNGEVPPCHTAWILSSLYNIICYIDYLGLSHNSISLDTFFISPKLHFGALLGGWWYTVHQNMRMLGVPEKTYAIMPPQVKAKGSGSILTDLESARLIGRELLGDENGTKLVDNRNIPSPLIYWLRGTASDSAIKDYSNWIKALEESFGKRRFVEMKLTEDTLYLKIKCK